MKRLTLLAALLFVALVPMVAQNRAGIDESERLQYIRERYAEEQLHATQSKDPEVPNYYTTITRRENKAAVGQCDELVEMFYDEVYSNDEDPYPSSYLLTYVRRSYNIAARLFYEEMLYDVDGQPLFWFVRYDGWFPDEGDVKKVEVRYYYDKGEILKAVYKVADENGKMKEVKDGAKYQEVFGEVNSMPLQHFEEFKEIFDVYYNRYDGNNWR